jgi:phosphomevalonate kinase
VICQASAPGKLFLVGEYSVLFGAPALVTAVDRRASVRFVREDGPLSIVASAGLGWEPARFAFETRGGLRWECREEVAGRFLLFERVLRSLVDGGLFLPAAAAPCRATLDTGRFYHRSSGEAIKLGLGSSAALTVALTSALLCWSGGGRRLEPEAGWLERLIEIHRALQGGRGSGADLAASLLGGVLEYRLDPAGSIATAAARRLPPGLGMVTVWTGTPADTGDLLERLSRRMDGDGDAGIRAAIDRMGEISAAAIHAVRHGDVAAFLELIADFGAGMEDLGRAAGIDIMSGRHRELGRLARRFGVAYKPSGAGGGDMGIGFSGDRDALDDFERAAVGQGSAVVAVASTTDGLRWTA